MQTPESTKAPLLRLLPKLGDGHLLKSILKRQSLHPKKSDQLITLLNVVLLNLTILCNLLQINETQGGVVHSNGSR